MTVFQCADNGAELSFSATGHAGFARPGEPDIVCASVSTLVSLLAELVLRAHGEANTTVILEPGEVFISAPATATLRQQFQVVVTGLEMLAEQYPNHVRFAHLRAEKEIDR
ncbi:MAG: ribosomal-processing cysteine protease Prp [Clostridia bacterium]|nr:ribosomal-processing cysteine protease Prp [Clostridia bacterium]